MSILVVKHYCIMFPLKMTMRHHLSIFVLSKWLQMIMNGEKIWRNMDKSWDKLWRNMDNMTYCPHFSIICPRILLCRQVCWTTNHDLFSGYKLPRKHCARHPGSWSGIIPAMNIISYHRISHRIDVSWCFCFMMFLSFSGIPAFVWNILPTFGG